MVSKSFPQESVPAPSIPLSEQDVVGRSALGIWLQIAFAYGLLEAALWTPPGRLDLAWMILTAAFILVMAFRGPYSAREMGVTFPTGKATIWIVGAGLILAATLWSFAALTGADAAPTHAMPLRTTWQYAVWAFLQQFMLQSFFFVRLESLLGSRRAVLATTILFAAAHIPNPILTIGSLFAGFFFCEMFRRYRNIFQLGVVHVILGFMMAACVSDALLHHRRSGIGFVQFHYMLAQTHSECMTKLLSANFVDFLVLFAVKGFNRQRTLEKRQDRGEKKVSPRALDNPVLQNASMIVPKP